MGPDFISPIDTYQGNITGPDNFGPGLAHASSAGSGDFSNIDLVRFAPVFLPFVAVPGGYIFKSFLSGDITFANSDFQDLGLTPGTYVWSWGTGPDADTFTIQIGVPEPQTWVLLLAGFGTLGLVGYRRTRKAQATG